MANPVVVAAAGWYATVLIPLLGKSDVRPRLTPLSDTLDKMLRNKSMCQLITRFTPGELYKLADTLGVASQQRTRGRWRFTPLHRLIIFLLSVTNYWPSRKMRLSTGWAANAILNNWRNHIAQIVTVLDEPGGGRQTGQPAHPTAYLAYFSHRSLRLSAAS